MCAVDCTSSHLPLPSPIPRSSVLFLLSSIPTEISLEEPLQGRFQMWCRAGGLLYHEVQEGKLCAVHCVNTALQGPFFSEFDLAALAADLDQRERLVMLEGSQSPGAANAAAGDFLAEGSHNVSLGGDFSIQVSPGPPTSL